MTKKKILHVTYDMRIGGTEQVIKNIVENCTDDNFDMSIYCIEKPLGPWGEALQNVGIPIGQYNRSEGFDYKLILKLRRYIIENQIDILHCHQYTPYIYGLFASFFTPAKVIFTEHGRFYPDSSSWKRLLINPLLAKLTMAVTCISKATKQALIDYEAFPEKKIDVIYNGIADIANAPELQQASEVRQALNLTDQAIVLGTIARLDPIKNQQLMLRAFATATQQNKQIALLIVGDGDERATLENLAQQLHIQDKVIFTGYKATPYAYLHLMDVFLLSSLSEGTSMTLLESMSLSKPCIVTDAGGNKEIIQHNINGLVTPNNDESAFAAAIVNLINNPSMLEQMAKNTRKLFIEKFSVKNMILQYQALYKR